MKKISKAEAERRRYIDETATRVASKVVSTLMVEETNRIRETIKRDLREQYRNEGAKRLARALYEKVPVLEDLYDTIFRIATAPPFTKVQYNSEQLYPLPPLVASGPMEVYFRGGPLHGQYRVVEQATPIMEVAVLVGGPTRALSPEQMDEPVQTKVARYRFWKHSREYVYEEE
jgi:hypothetical protein